MTPSTRAWRAGLVAFLVEDRQRPRHRSTPDPEPHVAAEAARVVTVSVQHWLDERLEQQLQRRRDLAAAHNATASNAAFDPDPAILLTTTPLGLTIAERLVADDPRGIVCLLEVEYRRWCRQQPDDAMEHHVTAWNWVKTSLPKVRQDDFPGHPLQSGETYWLHRTGIAGCTTEELRNTALLAFDGKHTRLLTASTVETRFET